jgi:hypothetical protein
MMNFRRRTARTLIGLTAALLSAVAIADRPMEVDDAAVGEVGSGNVKLWFTDVEGNGLTTVAGAYTLWKAVEIGAQVANGSGLTATGLQAKWQITPSQDNGCNVAASLGWTRVKIDGAGSANASGVNGLASCNGAGVGSVHFNLGYAKPSGGSGSTNWGVAVERSYGVLTPNLEVFGAEDIDTTVQVGLRGNLSKTLQLDGSIGRSDSTNIYTVGLRLQF